MIIHQILQYRLDWVVFVVLTLASAILALYLDRRHDFLGGCSWQNWLWIAMLVAVGGIAAEVFERRARLRLQETASFFTTDYACDLERLGHGQLTLDTPSTDAKYLGQIAAEKDWQRNNPTIAEVYTYRRLPDGRFVYIVCAESGVGRAGKPNGWRKPRTPIGASFRSTDEYVVRAANGEAVIDANPVGDEGGVWLRALRPMFDTDGRVEAVLGIKLFAVPWFCTLLMERLIALLQSYVLFVLVLGAVYISRQRSKLSERASTEAKLRESENRFRSLFENIPNIAVQGYDRDRRVIFWNRASELLYGFSREEAMGRQLETLIIPPPMREGVVAAIDNWKRTGVPIPASELVLQRKGGGPVSVFSSHVMQLGSRGEPEMYCVDIDLTERDRAQAALALSEVNYRTLFEVVPHPMWVYDVETFAFLAVNSAATEYYGYTRDEFMRMSLLQLLADDEVEGLLKHVARLPGQGSYGPTEWHGHKKSGEISLAETVSHALAWTGRRARIVLAQDITIRRQAERRIAEQAELLNKTNEAIVVVDLDQRITFWNRGAERLFCYTAAEMCGRPLVEMTTIGHVVGASEFAQTLGRVEGDWRGEIQGIDRNGRPLFIETSITLVRDGTGQPTARLSVSTDITKRKALESQVIQAQKMEVLGQLAGGVAHDFNSILMAMTLHVDMLEMDLRSNSAAVAKLVELKTMTQGAARLIGQLLLFARKHSMKPQPLELNEALAGVTKMLHRLLGANINLVLKGDGTNLWIKADAVMLDQVALNLCVNSRDAMPKGGTLTIETSLAEFTTKNSSAPIESRQGAFACMRVSDTGCGMSPEVLAHIFEPFFTTKEIGKGTGLGLSTVHGIVHQHQGWITVESKEGQGTTFLIYLPITSVPELEALDPVETSINGGDETILLVEDNEAVRRICAAMLLRIGYRVLPSEDGKNALRIWEKNPGAIDLLLCDVVLPGGMSGVELAGLLKLKQPSLAVVLMSGDNSEIIKADGLHDRGFKFVQKPIESTELANVIRSCLD